MESAAKVETLLHELPATGERYLPGMGGRIAAEHLMRYAFANRLVVNKEVLDVASGEGYGSNAMARTAVSVVGVDIAEDATLYARAKYSGVSNLSFIHADVVSLPFDNHAFDVITCFETIEHVDAPATAIKELKRVCKIDGTLIVSTPNKTNYSSRFEYANPFHKMELEFHDFRDTLRSHFKNVQIFGQFSGSSSFTGFLDQNGLLEVAARQTDASHADVPLWTGRDAPITASPLYFIAVCSDGPEMQPTTAVEFVDPTDWWAIEEEFLLRKLLASSNVNSELVHELIKQLQLSNVLRNRLDFAELKLVAERTQHERSLLQAKEDSTAEEVVVLRSAFNSLRAALHASNAETAKYQSEASSFKAALESHQSSTAWRMTSWPRAIATRSNFVRKLARSIFVTK